MRTLILSALLVGLPAVSAAAQDLDLGRGVRLKLAPIPAGTFQMGSPKGSVGAAYNESDRLRPNDYYQHPVAFTRPFLMGVTEITQAQYRAVSFSQVRRTESDFPVSDRSHALSAERWVSGRVTDSGR
ncbi:MAG: hypothetical protein RLZZ214_2578 [Verrucomicrobiota bacterium]